MNTNKANPHAAVKKHLASYSIWYRVCLAIMGLAALCYVLALVGWITGHTMSVFFAMNKQFVGMALESPYIILYMNYFGIALSAVMAVFCGLNVFLSMRDKESTFDHIRKLSGWIIMSVWAIPLYHAFADFAVTAMKIRKPTSFDIFDLGMSIWPMLAITVFGFAILLVNSKLGEVPADAEIE